MKKRQKYMKIENFGNKKKTKKNLWIDGDNKILWKYNNRIIKYCGHKNGERIFLYTKICKRKLYKVLDFFRILKKQNFDSPKMGKYKSVTTLNCKEI